MLLNWLKEQDLYPKIYWANANEAVAACGVQQHLTGQDFDKEALQTSCAERVAVAQRQGERENTKCEERLTQPTNDSLGCFWTKERALQFGCYPFDAQAPLFFSPCLIRSGVPVSIPFGPMRVIKSTCTPSQMEWTAQITKALEQIRAGIFEKVVLARTKRIECAAAIDPFALCAALAGKTVFFFQPDPSYAFLGASPETLYRRRGRHIVCDVLAGTRPFAGTEDLMRSEKDVREFSYVQRFLQDTLAPLCVSPLHSTPPVAKSYTTTSHLYAVVEGVLKEGVEDFEVIKQLHPTPAVGGYPRKEALSFLSAQEPFSRAFYAAPIGWRTEEAAEFTVGIRSAVVKDRTIQMYAGSGIVWGSEPSQEWEETEWKLSLWNNFF